MNPAIDKIYFVDDFRINNVHRPQNTIASAGGKGLNVARVAKLINEDVAAGGFLGGDNGNFIRRKLNDLGIIDKFSEIDGETRICINITDIKNNTSSEILESGPQITKNESEKFISEFERIIDDVDIVTFSGSLPKGLEKDYYAKLINVCHKHDKKVLLDTSGEAFINGVEAKPFMIKPNEDEIRAVYKGDVGNIDGIIEAIKYFMSTGIEFPVVSLGKDGSLAGYKDKIYHITIPPVKTKNTVGSGDSFVAGFAAGLSRGYSAEDVLKLASACGTANTQYEQTGYVKSAKVDEYFNKVQVKIL
jgi:tagatose 6-phosphate kinase